MKLYCVTLIVNISAENRLRAYFILSVYKNEGTNYNFYSNDLDNNRILHHIVVHLNYN